MITFDKVLATYFNHRHHASDVIDIPNRFVNITGDTMTGALTTTKLSLSNTANSWDDIATANNNFTFQSTYSGVNDFVNMHFTAPADKDLIFALWADGGDNWSPYLEIFVDRTTGIEFKSEGYLNIMTSDTIGVAPDGTDYIRFQTTSDVPEITTIGACDLKLTASSGTINFDNDHLTTTGDVTTADLKMSGGDIYPTADSTTAIQINKADGTTNVLNVDTTNARVGIGTTGPISKLDVSDGTRHTYIQSRSGAAGTGLEVGTDIASWGNVINLAGDLAGGGASGGVNIAMYSSGDWRRALSIKNGGNLLLVPDGFGNVGIGVAAPGAKLEVEDDSNPLAIFNRTTASSEAHIVIQAGGVARTYLGYAPANALLSSSPEGFKIRATQAFMVGTNDNNIRLTIDTSGNVGIGTAAPLVNLHILQAAAGGAAPAAGNDLLVLEGAANTFINFITGANQSGLVFSDGTRNVGSIIYEHGDDSIRLQTASNERMRILSGGNVGIGVTDPDTMLEVLGATGLKISFDATDNTTLVTDTNGDLTITASGDEIKVADWVRHTSASYRRYYHLPMSALDPGASGATWVDPSANSLGGWNLDVAGEVLFTVVDVHPDWDGASDLEVELYFAINDATTVNNDTADIKLVVYYNAVGDTATKSQTVEVSTVTDGTQWKVYNATFTINWDETDNNVEAGDQMMLCFNLETDTSEVDSILVTAGSFHYNTTHIGIESGDT